MDRACNRAELSQRMQEVMKCETERAQQAKRWWWLMTCSWESQAMMKWGGQGSQHGGHPSTVQNPSSAGLFKWSGKVKAHWTEFWSIEDVLPQWCVLQAYVTSGMWSASCPQRLTTVVQLPWLFWNSVIPGIKRPQTVTVICGCLRPSWLVFKTR